jgi:hypothetical protein
MATVIKAPQEYTQGEACDIFLGGSIDMGSAENWQERLTKDLSDYENIVILNPRRDDWDSSWKQDPTPGTQFYEQVSWELDQQENADVLVYYFAADSKSPITLLELGLFGADNVIVCCPKEFYRYGNVKMVCDRYEITMVETYEDMLKTIRDSLDEEGVK